MEKIRNNEDLHLDLLNGVVLKLKYNPEDKEYRGYWEEENIDFGIWTKEFLIKMATDEDFRTKEEYKVNLY
jgi:hypothetical protein